MRKIFFIFTLAGFIASSVVLAAAFAPAGGGAYENEPVNQFEVGTPSEIKPDAPEAPQEPSDQITIIREDGKEMEKGHGDGNIMIIHE